MQEINLFYIEIHLLSRFCQDENVPRAMIYFMYILLLNMIDGNVTDREIRLSYTSCRQEMLDFYHQHFSDISAKQSRFPHSIGIVSLSLVYKYHRNRS